MAGRWLVPAVCYAAATAIVGLSWYGWNYGFTVYGGDVYEYGVTARLAGWLFWFVPLGILVAVWQRRIDRRP